MSAIPTRQEIDDRQAALLGELEGLKEQLLSRYLIGLAVALGVWLIADATISPPSSVLHLLWIPMMLTVGLGYLIGQRDQGQAGPVLVTGLLLCGWCLVLARPSDLTVVATAMVLVVTSSLLNRWVSLLAAVVGWLGSLAAYRMVVPAGPAPELVTASGIAYALMAGVTWISESPMRDAANLALTAWEQLRESLLEARQRRAELHRVVRALEEATYRIERMNNELMLARQRAEAARENKARFAAMVSHELRGPLNLILGYSRLLALSPEQYGVPLPPPYRKDVHTIYSSSRHVVNLLDDILDLSQVEVDRMPLVREYLDLNEVLTEVEAVVRPLAERKGLGLNVDSEETPIRVFADRVRIRQVLINLLTNATRFTERGRIDVQARTEDDHALVRVRDTGRGIPDKDISRLFEEFSQLHLHEEGAPKGSGLGLAISRHLVEAHGGTIWARSQEGAGTEVFFTLPRLSPERPMVLSEAPGHDQAVASPHDVVLVLQQDPAVVRLMARHIGGYRIVGVPDPRSVMAAVQDHHPRAVIVDSDVAETLANQLRAAKAGVPVLACNMPSASGSSRLEGVFAFLIKPVMRETLERTVRQVPVNGDEMTVLIVDDDPDAVHLLQVMLEALSEPCRVLKAHDGKEALDVLARERPDLVLMDLLMPNLSGDETVRRMQADPELRSIPVAVVSASDALGPTATFGDYIGLLAPGPMDVAESLALVRSLLDQVTPRYLESPEPVPPSREAVRG